MGWGKFIVLCMIAKSSLCTLYAQDTLLPPVIVRDKKILNESNRQELDSLSKLPYALRGVSDLLMAKSHVSVNQYGLSHLSTLQLRGSSTAQSSVEWNGIRIQNPMLGLTDLSLIGSGMFEQIHIAYGGNNEVRDFQSPGGVLVLQDKKPAFLKSSHFSGHIGWNEFRNFRSQLHAQYATEKWAVQISPAWSFGDNRYRFKNFYKKGHKEEIASYAGLFQNILSVHHKPDAFSSFHIYYWAILNQREIPKLAYEDSSSKQENNRIHRLLGLYEWKKNKSELDIRSGYFLERFRYHDSLILLSSEAAVAEVPVNLNYSYFVRPDIRLDFISDHRWSSMNNTGTKAQLFRSFSGVSFQKVFAKPDMVLNTRVGKEFSSQFQVPVISSFSLQYRIYKDILLYARIGNAYRTPTLNELFFVPGGNRLLKPEYSRYLEGEVRYAHSVLSNIFHVYSRKVKDWILWNGSSVFFPSNIAEVWSRGFEETLELNYNYDVCRMRSQLLYSYTLATTRKTYVSSDSSIGKQIPYMPRYQAKYSQQFFYKNWMAEWNGQYVGYRFSTRDESVWLNPYLLFHFFLQYRIPVKQEVMIQLSANNISNQYYESVRGRIMPGRNFGLAIKWGMIH